MARKAAARFGLIYVDTGALYRVVGLHALRNNAGSKDEEAIGRLLDEIKLDMKYDKDGIQRMYLGDEDVTDDIRAPIISAYASDISAMPRVRAFLLEMQREMARKYDVIMDGRDIGTVVLPDAGLKIFMTAQPGTRAKRRYLELLGKNIDTSLEEVEREMELRDKNDTERAAAPLRAAEDAVLFDSTDMELGESYEALCGIIAERFGGKTEI